MPDKKTDRSCCCYRPRCVFYSEQELTASDRVLKEIYCASRQLASGCAIFLRFTACKPVPDSLCPNGDIRLKESESPERRASEP